MEKFQWGVVTGRMLDVYEKSALRGSVILEWPYAEGTARYHRTGALSVTTDVYLFRQGNHFRLYERLGSHPATLNDIPGTFFAVWAPTRG